MRLNFIFFICISFSVFSQNININNNFNYNLIKSSILKGEINSPFSHNIRPLDQNFFSELIFNEYKTIYQNQSGTISFKTLGIDYFIEFNSHHPYNRNNGTMIPNRGYQHIISPGVFLKWVLFQSNLSQNIITVKIKFLMGFGKDIPSYMEKKIYVMESY